MTRTLTPTQQAAHDERKAKQREMIKTIAAMTNEQRAQLASRILVTNTEGHVYSATNQILIAYQMDSATICAGFRQWIKAGRQVRKGEHGLSIWIPSSPKEDPNKQPGEMTLKDLETHFFMGTVFDISQTDPITEAEKEPQPC